MSALFLLGVPGKLKSLLDRLTAARATNLDKLDALVSSRAPASSALSNAVWTDARAAKLDNAIAIRRIQTGTSTISGTSQTSVTAAITAVNTAKAVLLYNVRFSGVGTQTGFDRWPGGKFDSSTQISFATSAALGYGASATIYWTVIEYNTEL